MSLNKRNAEVNLHNDWANRLTQMMRELDEQLSMIDVTNLFVARNLVSIKWQQFMSRYRSLLYEYRYDSAAIAYGELAEYHEHYFDGEPQEATLFPPLYEDNLHEILDKVGKDREEDGKNLVQRINAHERRIRSDLLAVLVLDNLTFEQVLGYKYRNGAYYQLARLSHNEFRKVHDAATKQINDYSPWVTKEKIHLSASHPPIGCVCEDIAGGVYEVGEISLPLHPNCGCYKTPVTISKAEFKRQMSTDWKEMNRYQNWLGVNETALTNPLLLVRAEAVLQSWLKKTVEVANAR